MKCFSPVRLCTPGRFHKDTLTGEMTDINYVPCGKCAACLHNRRMNWSARLQIELQYAVSASFVTFTYDIEPESYIDVVDDDGVIHSLTHTTCRITDIQKMIKRIRKKVYFRYFLVSEYGKRTGRPHYHGIFFGLPPTFDFQAFWPYGFVHIGSVTPASITYAAKYCVTDPGSKEYLKSINVEPPSAYMSRRPGIGLLYLNKQNIDRHLRFRNFSTITIQGKVLPMPRYIREKIILLSGIQK